MLDSTFFQACETAAAKRDLRPSALESFQIAGGKWVRVRFDLPLPGVGRFRNCLSERVA